MLQYSESFSITTKLPGQTPAVSLDYSDSAWPCLLMLSDFVMHLLGSAGDPEGRAKIREGRFHAHGCTGDGVRG